MKYTDKFYSGNLCTRSGWYSQFRDCDEAYAVCFDCYVKKGERFPATKISHHYRLKWFV